MSDLETKIAKLDLAPNDILVVKVTHHVISRAMADSLKAGIKDALGPEHAATRVLILDRGMELSVLTKAEIEDRA